jgi:sulfur-carrier protein
MKIRYFAMLRTITGVNEERWEVPTPTLGDLLDQLCIKYGAEFRNWVHPEAGGHGILSIILINGVDYRSRQGLQSELQPDDTIFVFPPVAGG